MVQETQKDYCEYRDDSDIDEEAFPEAVAQERDIHRDDDDYHREHQEQGDDWAAHFSRSSRYLDAAGLECGDDFGGGDELAGVALGVVGAVDQQGAYGGGELLAAYAAGVVKVLGSMARMRAAEV